MCERIKHRGPDSTGFALYGEPHENELIMRLKLAEQEETRKGFDIHKKLPERRQEVDRRINELGGKVIDAVPATEYAYRYRLNYPGDKRKLSDYIEDVEGVEILSLGSALEQDDVIKSALPGDMYRVFMHYKRDEWEKFMATVTDWDTEMYLDYLP